MISIYDYQNNKLADLRLEDDRISGEAHNIILKESLNGLAELEFSIPFYTVIDGIQEENWRNDFLVNEYKIRLTWQDYDEYFYIKNITEEHDKSDMTSTIQCMHISEMLNKRGVNKSIDIAGNASALLSEILEGSSWKPGTVSSFYKNNEEKIRTYQKDNSNCMEMLWDIAELFEGYIMFNSITKTVDLLNDIGQNNGVLFRYDKNIRNINRQYNTDDVVTRLWVIGGSVNDKIITISDVSPNKQPFIDNFSYFNALLTPEQKSSIKKYDKDILSINSTINSALTQILSTESGILDVENTINIKVIEKSAKQQTKDEIDAKILIERDSVVLSQLQEQSSSLSKQIIILSSEINNLQGHLNSSKNALAAHNINLAAYYLQKNTIEKDFRTILDEFIREGTYKNDNYIDAQALYDDAIDTLAKICVPKVEYNMTVVDLSAFIGYELEKIRLGDIIGITDELLQLGIDTPVAARITELTRYLDNPLKNTITIANFRDAFSDMWNRIARSAEIVKQRQEYYERSYLGLTDSGVPKGDMLQQAFDNNKFRVVNGTNNNVVYDKDGITIEDLNDSNKKLRINAGGVFITTDNGETWKVATSADGISALNIVSGVLDTKVIQIWNTEQPKFFWNSEGLFAYGSNDYEWIKFTHEGIFGTADNGSTYEFALTFAGLFIGNTPANEINDAILSFNNSNRRKSIAVPNPSVLSDGTAIDHTLNTDSTSNISFEWQYTESSTSPIDGFGVVVYSSTSSSPHTPNSGTDTVYYVDKTCRAFILQGQPANLYYTFGIFAYRMVDADINSNSKVQSAIVKSSRTDENPYRPSANVAFDGNITGTVNGVSASTLTTQAANSIQQNALYNKVKITAANGIQILDASNNERLKMGDLGSNVYGWYAKDSNGIIKTQIRSDGTIHAVDGYYSGIVSIGSGNNIFKADSNGIYLGHSSFASAPFKVNMNGILTATGANVSGNITMTGGSISWSNVNKPGYTAGEVGAKPYDWLPEYGEIRGSKPPANADNTIGTIGTKRLTYIDEYGIYTGTLTAEQINAIYGISLGAGASIDWGYINSDPKIATAQNTANSASSAASSAQSAADSAYSIARQIAMGKYSGGTFIDGRMIYSPDIYGGTLNIGNGNFTADSSGNLFANSATIKGTINSSNIYGSRFYNQVSSGWFEIAHVTGSENVADFKFMVNTSSQPLIEFYNGISSVDIVAFGNTFLRFNNVNNTTYPLGKWNFSSASEIIWGNNAPIAKFY